MNWRQQIVVNRRKSFMVILSFVLMYVLLGSFVAIMVTPHYGVDDWIPILQQPSSQRIVAVFVLVSLVIILISMLFGGKLSLTGTSAVEVMGDTDNADHKQLYNIVEEMKIASGLSFMPKVYVLPVKYMNAFAAGWHEKNSIIAITQPLLALLTREELQAVIAHELSHIKHQDTRVMTLVSIMAGLLVMVIDVMFRSVLYGNTRQRNRRTDASGLVVIVIVLLRVLIPFLTAFMAMYISRRRELLADAGCVALTRNKQALANALIKLHQAHKDPKMKEAYYDTPNEQVRSFAYIYEPKHQGVKRFLNVNEWFSTHPSLQERLKALGIE